MVFSKHSPEPEIKKRVLFRIKIFWVELSTKLVANISKKTIKFVDN